MRLAITAALLMTLAAPAVAQYGDQPVQTLHVYGGVLLYEDGSNNIPAITAMEPDLTPHQILGVDGVTLETTLASPTNLLNLISDNGTAGDRIGAMVVESRSDDVMVFRPSAASELTRAFLGDNDHPFEAYIGLGVNLLSVFGQDAQLLIEDGDHSGAFHIVLGYDGTMPAGTVATRLPATAGIVGDGLRVASIGGDGSAQLAWSAFGGGCPAGDDDFEVQYNAAGICGASSKLRFLPTGGVNTGSELQLIDTANHSTFWLSAPAANQAEIRVRRTSDNAGWSIYRPASSLDLRLFATTGGDRFTFTQAGHLWVNTDSISDLGQGGADPRFRFGFADVWNAESFEISNAAHTSFWQMRQRSGDTGILDFFTAVGGAIPMSLEEDWSGSDEALVIPATSRLAFTANSGSAHPSIFDASAGGNRILTVDSRLRPTATNLYDLGETGFRWRSLFLSTINIGANADELLNLGSASSRGSATFYSNTGSQITQVQIRASAADNLADSLVIRNASAAERVKAGVSNGGATGSLAVLSAAGRTITLNASGNAATEGLFVDVNRVVGARGAAVANATDAASVILRLNEALARLRAHGLIAP